MIHSVLPHSDSPFHATKRSFPSLLTSSSHWKTSNTVWKEGVNAPSFVFCFFHLFLLFFSIYFLCRFFLSFCCSSSCKIHGTFIFIRTFINKTQDFLPLVAVGILFMFHRTLKQNLVGLFNVQNKKETFSLSHFLFLLPAKWEEGKERGIVNSKNDDDDHDDLDDVSVSSVFPPSLISTLHLVDKLRKVVNLWIGPSHGTRGRKRNGCWSEYHKYMWRKRIHSSHLSSINNDKTSSLCCSFKVLTSPSTFHSFDPLNIIRFIQLLSYSSLSILKWQAAEVASLTNTFHLLNVLLLFPSTPLIDIKPLRDPSSHFLSFSCLVMNFLQTLFWKAKRKIDWQCDRKSGDSLPEKGLSSVWHLKSVVNG